MNRLSTDKQVQVVSALVEGNSLRSIVGMTGSLEELIGLLNPAQQLSGAFNSERE